MTTRQYKDRKVLGYKIAIEFNTGAVSYETGLPLKDVYEINKQGTSNIPSRNPEPYYSWIYRRIKKIQKDIEIMTNKKVIISEREAEALIKQNVNKRLKPTEENEDLITNIENNKVSKYKQSIKDKQGYLMKNIKIRGIRKDKTQTRYVSASDITADIFNGYWLISATKDKIFPELLITYNLYDPKKYQKYEASPFHVLSSKIVPLLKEVASDYLKYTKNTILEGNRLATLADETLKYRKYFSKKHGIGYTDTPLYFTGTLYNNMRCVIYKNDKMIIKI